MKKLTILTLFSIIFFSGCSTIKQNIDARKNLAKCKYEFEKIEVEDISLDGINLKSVVFNVFLKITNTTKTDVAMDHVEADIFLDTHKTTSFKHDKFLRIKPAKSVIESISVKVPIASAIKILGHKPQNITVKSKIFMSLLIDDYTLETPVSIELEKTFPIPYDKIEELIKQQSGKAVDKIQDKAKKSKKKIKVPW